MNFGLGNHLTHRVLFVTRSDSVFVLTVRHAAQDEWNPHDE